MFFRMMTGWEGAVQNAYQNVEGHVFRQELIDERAHRLLALQIELHDVDRSFWKVLNSNKHGMTASERCCIEDIP